MVWFFVAVLVALVFVGLTQRPGRQRGSRTGSDTVWSGFADSGDSGGHHHHDGGGGSDGDGGGDSGDGGGD